MCNKTKIYDDKILAVMYIKLLNEHYIKITENYFFNKFIIRSRNFFYIYVIIFKIISCLSREGLFLFLPHLMLHNAHSSPVNAMLVMLGLNWSRSYNTIQNLTLLEQVALFDYSQTIYYYSTKHFKI